MTAFTAAVQVPLISLSVFSAIFAADLLLLLLLLQQLPTLPPPLNDALPSHGLPSFTRS